MGTTWFGRICTDEMSFDVLPHIAPGEHTEVPAGPLDIPDRGQMLGDRIIHWLNFDTQEELIE